MIAASQLAQGFKDAADVSIAYLSLANHVRTCESDFLQIKAVTSFDQARLYPIVL
jgi:hypothetical protein